MGKPSPRLYHVTSWERTQRIVAEGFNPQAPPIAPPTTEPDGKAGQEVRAIFRDILDQHRPQELPSHAESVFFLPDSERAQQFRRGAERVTGQSFRILEVDSGRVPCTCYQADERLANELWSEIERDRIRAQFCTSWEPAPRGGMRDYCEQLAEKARRYYRSMQPYHGDLPGANLEVICPCRIPSEAIVREL